MRLAITIALAVGCAATLAWLVREARRAPRREDW